MIIEERRRCICDVCEKELTFKDVIYGRKFERCFFDRTYPAHICGVCFDELKELIKERKANKNE